MPDTLAVGTSPPQVLLNFMAHALKVPLPTRKK